MTTMEGDTVALARRWLCEDHDPSTKEEIRKLLFAQNHDELERRLRKRITFGTAGLRAPMKAGYAYMNSLTVVQTSEGLARYIIDYLEARDIVKQRSVVIGYDARHNSEKFARLAAYTFLMKGFMVFWFGRFVHTPLVPFTVKTCMATAGIMITASHNPKDDNGYKLYWSNGSQIIPPHDVRIAEAIEKHGQVIFDWSVPKNIEECNSLRNVYKIASKGYFRAISELVSSGPPVATNLPNFVYTPMHGVGLPFMKEALLSLPGGRHAMRVFEEQAQPDPDFPTVPFPNPEEKNALNLPIREARRQGCSLVLANDPDADRFSVAEQRNGDWFILNGNQIGILFASYILETYKGDKKRLTMLTSTVSSRMLAYMAGEEGFQHEDTLTGFKWLGNVGQRLKQEGEDVRFAYEEAIGYMFPSVVWDKDGITAAIVFLQACALWRSQGLTPWTKLEQLTTKYGCFQDANTYLISPSPEVTTGVFNDIRWMNNGERPEKLGKRNITAWRDLTTGFDDSRPGNKAILPVDPTIQMISCKLDDALFTARSSGTEPKIKLYIEARATTGDKAKSIALEVQADLVKEWFPPEKGLKLANSEQP